MRRRSGIERMRAVERREEGGARCGRSMCVFVRVDIKEGRCD